MRSRVDPSQEEIQEIVGTPVLRCDVAGGGAGLLEDGGVPGVYGEGVREGDIPEPGATEEPDRGLVRREREGEEAVPSDVGGEEAVGEGL